MLRPMLSPVSYTHLIDALIRKQVTSGALPISTGAIVPVSYTHLDVYKRQGYWYALAF